MIFTVWTLALVISLAQLGWKDEGWKSRIEERQCSVNQDKYYQIFATLSSFYVPLAVILFLYWKIFQAARKRIRKRRPPGGGGGGAASLLPRPAAETSLITTASSSNPSPEKTVLINNYGGVKDHTGPTDEHQQLGTSSSGGGGGSSSGPDSVRRTAMHHQLLPPSSPNSSTGITPETTPARKIKATRESGESKRERKAAKTLAIITGMLLETKRLQITLSVGSVTVTLSVHYLYLFERPWDFSLSLFDDDYAIILSPPFQLPTLQRNHFPQSFQSYPLREG